MDNYTLESDSATARNGILHHRREGDGGFNDKQS